VRTGRSEAWYRARFGVVRSLVRIRPPRYFVGPRLAANMGEQPRKRWGSRGRCSRVFGEVRGDWDRRRPATASETDRNRTAGVVPLLKARRAVTRALLVPEASAPARLASGGGPEQTTARPGVQPERAARSSEDSPSLSPRALCVKPGLLRQRRARRSDRGPWAWRRRVRATHPPMTRRSTAPCTPEARTVPGFLYCYQRLPAPRAPAASGSPLGDKSTADRAARGCEKRSNLRTSPQTEGLAGRGREAQSVA
jgi:hypothetical protein